MIIELDKNTKYIIGLSGGPDSMFLINEACKLIPKENLVACHVNYNYRKNSYIDQNIVEDFCLKNNIKLFVKNINPETYEASSKNFEELARLIRYDFFIEKLSELSFDKILIAHNLNDDIETFLMQIKRKNIVDYFGLQSKSLYKNLPVERPMLKILKSEILKKLDEEQIKYAIDETNYDLNFLRNRIRSKISNDDLAKNLVLKKYMNIRLNEIKNIVDEKISLLEGNEFDLSIFTNDFKINIILIYKIFEKLNLKEKISKRKHKTLQELIKQIKSNKKNIEFTFSDIKITKNNKRIQISTIY